MKTFYLPDINRPATLDEIDTVMREAADASEDGIFASCEEQIRHALDGEDAVLVVHAYGPAEIARLDGEELVLEPAPD